MQGSWLNARAAGPALAAALLAACGAGSEPRSGAETLAEARRMYEEALARAPEGVDEVVGWAREDIGRIGDWEYRIVSLEAGEPAAQEEALNALGEERWEAFWVAPQADGALRVYLKRPAISYLRSLPLSEIKPNY